MTSLPPAHRAALPFFLIFGVAILVGGNGARSVKADEGESFSDADLEFFEKEVRPVLSRRCYSCHSAKAKKIQGGLRVDSRALLIEGGDTGPGIEPGKPEESLFIDAINYGDIYQMPPKGKLPKTEIAVLTRWVKAGAPWPKEATVAAAGDEFDIDQRRQAHWSWKPVAAAKPPAVKRAGWPRDSLDQFILARLEQAGLSPAEDADRRTLIRRLYFDLIGLPPTPAEVEEFVADQSPKALESVVDRLLESKHFGERWARHWLDLMRYAESRGHEFDYATPNAFEYRDYVIRALNADVPYDEFVIEHIAGDLLPKPRRNSETGANESILATGFWFLGEWCHSPVDIRKDETDRFDNMIDVFSKSFLGLTVACARCHDHKFDAISQADYYALFGYLQSSAYRQVRFESLAHNRSIAREAEQLRRKLGKPIVSKSATAIRKSDKALVKYITAAVDLLRNAKPAAARDDIVLFDFEQGDYEGWTIEGDAFGGAPQDAQSIAKYQGDVNARGRFFVNSHNKRASLEQKEAEHSDRFTGVMTSPEFVLQRNRMTMLIGGGAHAGRTCVNLLVDGKTVRTATGRNHNRMQPATWDVARWAGKKAQIQVVDRQTGGWGNIGLDHVVLTDEGAATPSLSAAVLDATSVRAERDGLATPQLRTWIEEIFDAKHNVRHPLHVPVAYLLDGKQAAEGLVRVNKNEPADMDVIANFSRVGLSEFIQDGVSFGDAPIGAAEAWWDGETVSITEYGAARRSPLFRKLKLAGGVERDSGRLSKWDRAGKTIRTKTFVLNPQRVYSLVRGRGLSYGVVDSHRMINGPLHGSLLREFDTKGELQWVEHNLARYSGHNAHMEFVPLDEQPFEVLRVVQSDRKPEQLASDPDEVDRYLAKLSREKVDGRRMIQVMVAGLDASARAVIENHAGPRDLARLNCFVSSPALLGAAAKDVDKAKDALSAAMAKLTARVRNESRTAPAMWDGTPLDDVLLIRGNNKTPGAPVPRRMLTALGGKPDEALRGSGRLHLARQLMSPENPYAARVMVNRIWGQLTGRAIVPSPDNFGVLGQGPSHPELLDHLANRFIENGYSIKKTIRQIVLSRTYGMSSTPSDAGAEKDPNNELLHRMRIRRLESEAIRDVILAVAGRLDRKMFGKSVPVYLTSFMQGRGRPRSGPLDGAGRRSIYISVRRNFLSPMMLAFDTPQPFSSVGRRTVSNVPGQALILMNDPFVIEMSRKWAREVIKSEGDAKERIQRIYLQAFSRPPTATEMTTAQGFLRLQAKQYGIDEASAQNDERIWADLCHVYFNVKEFIFIR